MLLSDSDIAPDIAGKRIEQRDLRLEADAVAEIEAMKEEEKRVRRRERGAKGTLQGMIRESGLHPTMSGLFGIPCFDAFQVSC